MCKVGYIRWHPFVERDIRSAMKNWDGRLKQVCVFHTVNRQVLFMFQDAYTFRISCDNIEIPNTTPDREFIGRFDVTEQLLVVDLPHQLKRHLLVKHWLDRFYKTAVRQLLGLYLQRESVKQPRTIQCGLRLWHLFLLHNSEDFDWLVMVCKHMQPNGCKTNQICKVRHSECQT